MAKKQQKEKVRCINCIHSELFQWDENPVIAKCPNLLYRQVANAQRTCDNYIAAKLAKEITKLTHRT